METRKVLSEQREELQRSVEVSNRQTEIMQRTLDAANSRDTYDEFKLRLYYLASYIDNYNHETALWTTTKFDDGNSHVRKERLFRREITKTRISEDDTASIDDLFRNVKSAMGFNFSGRSEKLSREHDHQSNNGQFLYYLSRIVRDLKELLQNERYQNVPLVAARTRALDLAVLLQKLEALHSEIHAAVWPPR